MKEARGKMPKTKVKLSFPVAAGGEEGGERGMSSAAPMWVEVGELVPVYYGIFASVSHIFLLISLFSPFYNLLLSPLCAYLSLL